MRLRRLMVTTPSATARGPWRTVGSCGGRGKAAAPKRWRHWPFPDRGGSSGQRGRRGMSGLPTPRGWTVKLWWMGRTVSRFCGRCRCRRASGCRRDLQPPGTCASLIVRTCHVPVRLTQRLTHYTHAVGCRLEARTGMVTYLKVHQQRAQSPELTEHHIAVSKDSQGHRSLLQHTSFVVVGIHGEATCPAPSAVPQAFSLLTLNIWHTQSSSASLGRGLEGRWDAYMKRLRHLVSVIVDSGADVVGLQVSWSVVSGLIDGMINM